MNALVFFTYRFLQWLALPLLIAYFLWRILKDRRYLGRFRERLGFIPASWSTLPPRGIWFHAVSVGEVLSSARLLEAIKSALPSVPVFLSVTTVAGRKVAEDRLSALPDGIFYAPLDYPFAARRVLRRLRPAVLVILETELWPNLFREAKRAGCGLLVINARISDRTWPRYRALRWFFKHVVRLPDGILAQSQQDWDRFMALGADANRISFGGNLKYDFQPAATSPPEDILRLLRALNPASIWIAASTMPPARANDVDEDDAVLASFRQLTLNHPRLLLILVPRKPERFDVVAGKLSAACIPYVRRSELAAGATLGCLPGVLLLDSVGELASLFSLECVVFMGGTLADRGGHNVLEPAFYGRPIVVGPHMENFPEIAAEFRSAHAWLEIQGGDGLAPAVQRLLADRALQHQLGERARQIVERRRGATRQALQSIVQLHSRCFPAFLPPFPLRGALWMFSGLWLLGVRWRQWRQLRRRKALRTPVVSVGNLTVGGSGKTPFVLWLAERLAQAGLQPAIITRGYRRLVAEKITLAGPGEQISVARTGDEAQLFIRSAIAPVAISANRFEAGLALEQAFQPGVMLLDDGFQHFGLERAIDIVLIDALDPFGGARLFPLGRLREPMNGLARADLLVLTRSEHLPDPAHLQQLLRSYNAHAPILLARTRAVGWLDASTGELLPADALRGRSASAFCGLGNPHAFWSTLTSLGVRPILRRTYADHHRYRPRELRWLAVEARRAGASVLLTTEKDFMNCPPDAWRLVAPVPLLCLRITVEPSSPEKLLEFVRERIAAWRRHANPASPC